MGTNFQGVGIDVEDEGGGRVHFWYLPLADQIGIARVSCTAGLPIRSHMTPVCCAYSYRLGHDCF